MSINYEKIGWDTSKYINPTNMNHMDDGIKAACDGVDKLTTDIGTADLSKIGDGTVTGAVAQNAKDIADVNSNLTQVSESLSVIGGTSNTIATLKISAKANHEIEYTLLDNIPNGTYIISAVTHVDNAPIPTDKRLFAAIASRAYTAATSICSDNKSWQWNQTIFFKGTGCVVRVLPEFDFACELVISLFLMRIK